MENKWEDRVEGCSYIQHSLCKTLPDQVNDMIASKEPNVLSYIGKEESVLEIGCGQGRWSQFLCIRKKYKGIDVSKKAVSFCSQRFNSSFEVMDATDLSQFENNSFDIIFWSNMLPGLNIEDRLKLYEEVQRVAKHKIIFLDFVMFWPFSLFVEHPLKHKELLLNLSGTQSLCDSNQVVRLKVFWLLYGSLVLMKLFKSERFLYSILNLFNVVDMYMPSAYRLYIFDKVV